MRWLVRWLVRWLGWLTSCVTIQYNARDTLLRGFTFDKCYTSPLVGVLGGSSFGRCVGWLARPVVGVLVGRCVGWSVCWLVGVLVGSPLV